MHKSKSFYFLASIFVIVAISAVFINLHFSNKPQSDSATEQAKLIRDARLREKLSRPYGKIEVPAEVYVDFIDSEDSQKPVEIIVSAATDIPVDMTRIILNKSQVGSETEDKETLWTDMSSGKVDKTIVYNAGILSVGKHQFNVAMEFLPSGENSKVLLAIGTLFLDIRPAEILSSNVSFGQIERLELHKELEKRVLVSIKPQLKNASSKILAQESMALEKANPGIIDRKIQELIASDSEVAQMVEEINSNIDEPLLSSRLATLSSQVQTDANEIPALGGIYKPISDVEVPVPDEFRN